MNKRPIGILKCFSKEEYRQDFLNGNIYFKASGYFRKLEDTYRGDKNDGKKPIDVKLSEISIKKAGEVVVPNSELLNVVLGFDGDDKVPIFCCSALNYNILNCNGNRYTLKEEFIKEIQQFGKYFAYVSWNEFANKMDAISQAKRIGYEIGEVTYADIAKKYAKESLAVNNLIEQYEVFFYKDESYKWQNEIRVILDSPDGSLIGDNDYYVLNVGGFSNVRLWDINELNKVTFYNGPKNSDQ